MAAQSLHGQTENIGLSRKKQKLRVIIMPAKSVMLCQAEAHHFGFETTLAARTEHLWCLCVRSWVHDGRDVLCLAAEPGRGRQGDPTAAVPTA